MRIDGDEISESMFQEPLFPKLTFGFYEAFQDSISECLLYVHKCYSLHRHLSSISGLVAEYIVAIDVTRARFLADASLVSMLLSRPISTRQFGRVV